MLRPEARYDICDVCGREVPVTQLVFKRFVYLGGRFRNLLPSSFPSQAWTFSPSAGEPYARGSFVDRRRTSVSLNNVVSVRDGLMTIPAGTGTNARITSAPLQANVKYRAWVAVGVQEQEPEQLIKRAMLKITDAGNNVFSSQVENFFGRQSIWFDFMPLVDGAVTFEINVDSDSRWFFEHAAISELTDGWRWGFVPVENSSVIDIQAGKRYTIAKACTKCRDLDPERPLWRAVDTNRFTGFETYQIPEWDLED